MISSTLKKAERWFVGGYALTAAGAAGYLIAFAVGMAAWWFVDNEQRALDIAQFGETAAAELAHLAAEPLLRDDRIELGLVAKRLLDQPRISRIAVYTVDNQPLVVIGEAALPNAPAYTKQITVQDAVVGYVSVTLDASRFGLPVLDLLAASWLFWLIGFAATVAGCAVADRMRAKAKVAKPVRPPDPLAHHEHQGDTYIVVANLFKRSGVDSAARQSALRHGAAIAARVADLYAGQSAELPGTGILLTLGHTDSLERGFEAVCAALLMRRLCRGLRTTDGHDAGLFRYGLDLAPGDVAGATPLPGDDGIGRRLDVSDVALLSSLAPSGELIIGVDAYANVEQPDRLLIDAVEDAAARALSFASTPKGIVRGVAEEYDNLLRSQAELIAEAMREEAPG